MKTIDKILKAMSIPKDKKSYNLANRIARHPIFGIRSNGPDLTEKEFYIMEIRQHYDIQRYFAKLDECDKKGHIEDNNDLQIDSGRGITYYRCKRCNLKYSRRTSSDEYSYCNKLNNTPTI